MTRRLSACIVLALLAIAPEASAAAPLMGSAAYGDWHDDAPGVVRHIMPDTMPPPFASSSARRGPSVVPRPVGAALRVPSGFRVTPFASGLHGPRTLRVAPNGDVIVAESAVGRLLVLRGDPDAGRVQSTVFAENLSYPFGIAFWPPGQQPRYLYVAETGRVVRFPYRSGDRRARDRAEVVVSRLPTGGHATRDLVFARDGRTMFVSVGSAGNIDDAGEEERADVLAFDPDGSNRRIFATGLRNCTAEAVAPATGELWCAVNERDGLGDDLPPDYVTSVQQDGFYGWPWYYVGNNPDPRLRGRQPERAGPVTVPDVLIQPHSAPLGIAFYDGTQFPPQYRGDAFVTLRGSWNRARRTGYKLIRLRFADGRPTGECEDFLTGFVVSDQAVWGRPVGITVAQDGALLISEDGNGTIWRITYGRGAR